MADSPGYLLTNKVEVPVIDLRIVRRDSLIKRLVSSEDRRVILMIAPTGYGKTTLIVEWLTHHTRNHHYFAWVTFDQFDNIPLRFWSYVSSSLTKACPRFHLDPQPLIEQEQNPADLTLLNPLLNEIASVPHHITLILDDYHIITNEAIHHQLAYFIEHLPHNLSLLLSSRVQPPIHLSRLRAQRRLLEFTEADLSFSLSEAQAFLVDVMGMDINQAQVAALWNATEGWIAGLQLAALSYSPSSHKWLPPPDMLHDDQIITGYFTEEVLNQQNEEARDFLLKSSVLDELSAPICDAVLGRNDSERLLKQIDGARLFMVRLDNHGSYRYHRLFAAALQTRLWQSDPQAAAELHRRACDWSAANGQPNRAIAHAFAAGSLDKAAEIIETCTTEAFLTNDVVSILRWTSLLSSQDAIFTRYPRLGIFYALAHFFLRRLDLVHAIILKIEQVFAAGDRPLSSADRLVQWQLSALKAVIEVSYGNRAKGIPDLQAALSNDPPVDHFFYGLISHTLAVGYREVGELEKAASTFHDAYRRTSPYTPAYAVRSLCAVAQIRQRQARLRVAHQHYQDAVDRYIELNIEPTHTGVALAGLLETTLEQNDLPRAEWWASKAMVNRRQILADPSPWARIGLAAIDFSLMKYYAALGVIEEAMHYLTDLKIHGPYDLEATSQPLYQWIEAQVLIGLAMKEQQMGGSLLAEAQTYLNEKAELTHIEILSHARIHRAHAHYSQAIALLENAEAELRKTQEQEYLIRTLILEALVYQDQSQTETALRLIADALSLAQPNGYVRLFVNEGSTMRHLLNGFLVGAHGEDLEGYVGQILAAFDTMFAPPADNIIVAASELTTFSESLPELSERERDVLHLLAAHLSYKEIAATLTISVNTVKIHVRNIYRKLGVVSRAMALERARELQSLDD